MGCGCNQIQNVRWGVIGVWGARSSVTIRLLSELETVCGRGHPPGRKRRVVLLGVCKITINIR